MSSPAMPASQRKTIAVFASQVGRGRGAEFLAGIRYAAEEHDVNLVHFVGGTLTPLVTPAQQPSYGLYDLVKPEQFDGLILTADVAYGTSPEDLQTFARYFSGIPIVTQSVDLDGASVFIPNNTEGMRAAMRHLIEQHGYKHIAFIRGIRGQIDAEQRFGVYQDELKAHNLRLDPDLVMDGDFTLESGRQAIRTLLGERGLRVQAVVAANDYMAFGALEALQQRGVRVPDDIAVTGFDDLREAQATGVPLTTVRQSFYTAGRNALETLLQRIQGDTVPRQIITPTQLLIRWSCGCLPENVRQAAVAPRDVAKTGRLENKREAALRALLNSAGVTEQDPALQQFREAFGRAWDAFLVTLGTRSSGDDFLKAINAMIELMQQNGLPPTIWHNVISMMRRYALGGIPGHTTMLLAENLFQQARLLAGELSQRSQAYRRLVLEQQENVLHAFSFSMAPAMSMEGVGAAISEHFPGMGIERWYVMSYDEVTAPQSTSSPPPQSYHLLFQYEAPLFNILREQFPTQIGQLIPQGKMPGDRRYSAVVMPLSLAGNRFGFMWTEMGPSDWEVYVRVRNLVSSALLRIVLVQQKEQAQKQVERLLGEARERATELAIAKEFAERTAAENAKLFSSEHTRRQAAEALTRSARQLSSLGAVAEVLPQVVSQLGQLIPSERCALFLEDVNGIPRLSAHAGFPANAPVEELAYTVRDTNVYHHIARQSEPMVIGDIKNMQSWKQPDWAPEDRAWLGIPLYAKHKVMGMLALSRNAPASFNQDDVLLANAFAMQASIALENARLYDDLNRIYQMMERMVEQRVEELNSAYRTLEKLDKNKSDFIQVAAHELRTPLTVIKGYLGMIKAAPAVQQDPGLAQIMEGVIQGTNRLHEVVNSML
ncbi:MAG TPA: substrate-binding domain-containing protein, partial [Anaerolineales bacterium]|nr:substrate-binding domain-containing protein [Anaerolineales bacterium]